MSVKSYLRINLKERVIKNFFDSHMSICWAMTMDPSLPFSIRDSEYGALGIFPTCKSFRVLQPFLIETMLYSIDRR